MPTPTSTSASSTLTAAMIPSNRLVVARLASMVFASERRGLAGSRIRQRRTAVAKRVVQQPPALACRSGRPVHRAAETVELARHVIERRLDLPPQRAAMVGEEQIPRDPTEDCTRHHCRHYHSRVL